MSAGSIPAAAGSVPMTMESQEAEQKVVAVLREAKAGAFTLRPDHGCRVGGPPAPHHEAGALHPCLGT